MFRPVSARPDFVAQEHDLLREWAERKTFARLRAQNAGNPRWSFLDGPITANNPMGVHHAWGRTYKDLYQRFHAMLGEDQRYQNGFDCQGLWVEVNVERDLNFKSKRDIEAFGIAEFVSLCKQRVLTFAARQTEQSIRLGYWMDWNDPAELLRLRDLLRDDPTQPVTIQGPDGPVTDTVEMVVGRLGMPDVGGSYFTFSNENNDLIWGFLAECHRRGWVYRGHDTMPWCPRCGTGLSQMEMNEGYQDREDPGLTVRFPLVDRPGEALLVWTTTPWTLAANVAAAVGADLRYVKVRQGQDHFWLGKGTLKQALRGPFQIVEERAGSELAGWRYTGPYDELPAVRDAFTEAGYEHRVVSWTEVGEEEGTGIVHIAPGCGAEDYQLGREIGLPVIGPIDEDGRYYDGFDWLSGREAPDISEAILSDLEQRRFFYHVEPYSHRYPHCWRCGTPLLFRLVDEWYISMGEVYDRPRDQLTKEEVDASLRYQIMEVVDRIRWIPDFGYERELDWLLNMRDWMISKKRYYGLALPIYDCRACGAFDVIGGREELRTRAVEGWDAFEGHTPHRPFVDGVKIACPSCGEPVSRIADVGNPWLDAGIVPFSTMHYREDPETWAKWFPADFITESFPGQFRNWFYAMLAMSTVLRREEPFRTIFGYATLFGEDGRPMHKSWGNAIEFDEAAERMGVDVMRWMYASARPDDNILFGWHAADEARRGLLVLWNVYAFFVSYARLAGWAPAAGAPPVAGRPPLDRWILSRSAGVAAQVEARLRDYDVEAATRILAVHVDDLSTWYLRLSRRRMSRGAGADRDAAFATLHEALVALARTVAPILPFLSESMYANLVVEDDPDAPDSVHLTPWPAPELAPCPGRGAGGGDGRRPPGRGPLADAPRAGRPQDAPAARAALAGAAGQGADGAGRAAGARPRRGQRQGGGADRRRVRAGGPGRQGPPAARRQAPGAKDPRGHGRRPRRSLRDPRGRFRDAGGRDARQRRGRDPGNTAPGHRGGPRRRHGGGHRHVPHPGAPRGGRRPRADPRGPGPAQGGRAGPRRPDRAVGRGHRRGGGAVSGLGRQGDPRRRAATRDTAGRPAGRDRPSRARRGADRSQPCGGCLSR